MYEYYKGRMKKDSKWPQDSSDPAKFCYQMPYKTNAVVKALWIWKLKLELWTPVSTGSGETKQVP